MFRRAALTAAVLAAITSLDAAQAPAWPSFRGRQASGVADGERIPDRWNLSTGEHVVWQTALPGLAHSSPIVWDDLVFVTTAISCRDGASFR
jgi:outer membrane protein assembly factor BamB